MIEESRGFKTLDEFSSALKDWLVRNTVILNDDGEYTVNQASSGETKARIVRGREHINYLYVRTPVLKEFVRMHYVASLDSVKKQLGIGDSVVKRFGTDQLRCYEFILE